MHELQTQSAVKSFPGHKVFPSDQVWFSRKEAALYLTSVGCPVTHNTLTNLARGDNALGGPSFYRLGWHTVRYKREDLDKWALKKCVRIE